MQQLPRFDLLFLAIYPGNDMKLVILLFLFVASTSEIKGFTSETSSHNISLIHIYHVEGTYNNQHLGSLSRPKKVKFGWMTMKPNR